MAYTYDPVNQRLLTTTITHPDGSQRILSDEVNNYFVPVSSTYGAPAAPVYTQTAVTDALGLPVSMSYKGSAGQVSLGTDYNPDLSVKDKTINNQVTNSYIYDSVGNLVSIANDLNGKPVRTYGYGYNTKGQVSTRTATTEKGVSTQTYTYTPQGQLLHFTCNGKECPQNLFKQPVSAIDYSYQPLFNSLNTVDETLNGGSKQLITYQYKNTDPTQVSGIDYAGKGQATFSFDGDGNITAMQKMTASGKLVPYQMSYDSAQNLTDVTINHREKIHYTYDASGQQIAESDTNAYGKTTTLQQYYNGSLAEQSLNGKSRYYVAGGSFYDGRYESAITDGKQLTGSVVNGKVQGDDVYMPYGQVTDLNQAKTLALTLQKSTRGYQMKNTDQVTGWQFLGNGYRAYDPALRLFTKHDSASPWGAGGTNAYNYAGNDPINSSDPTGHYTENDVNDVNKTMKTENKQIYDNYHKSQLELIIAICAAVVGLILSVVIPGPGEFIEGAALGFLADVVFFTLIAVATSVATKVIENGVLEQKGYKPSQSIGEMMSSASFWEGVGIDAGVMVAGEIAGLVIKEAGRVIEDVRSAGRAGEEAGEAGEAGEAAAGEAVREGEAGQGAAEPAGEPRGQVVKSILKGRGGIEVATDADSTIIDARDITEQELNNNLSSVPQQNSNYHSSVFNRRIGREVKVQRFYTKKGIMKDISDVEPSQYQPILKHNAKFLYEKSEGNIGYWAAGRSMKTRQKFISKEQSVNRFFREYEGISDEPKNASRVRFSFK